MVTQLVSGGDEIRIQVVEFLSPVLYYQAKATVLHGERSEQSRGTHC